MTIRCTPGMLRGQALFSGDFGADGRIRVEQSAPELDRAVCGECAALAGRMAVVIARPDRVCVAFLCAAVAVLLVTLLALGGLSGAIAPDTASYFFPFEFHDLWGEMRHPLYGEVARLLGGSADNPGHIVLIQGLLHAAAALALYAGARVGGVGSIGALCLGLAALFSQSALYHLRLVLPEAPAVAFLIFAFAGVMAAANSVRAYRLMLLPIALATGLAYLLRPSFLPAILTVPVLWYLLALRNGQARRAARAALLFCLVAAPFLIQSAYRWRTVGDFNVVSFGGFAMAAPAGFMLTPDIVASLPDRVRPTAQAVLSAREAAEAAGRVPRTPRNSVGERSFVSAALGYFDIYARAHDDFLWGEIVKLRAPGESWVGFNRRMASFAIATFRAAPLRWAAWVGGATSRLVGRMIVTDAPMLIAFALLLIVAMPAFVQRATLGACATDLPVVCIVALAWLAATGPLAVLMTIPATRYIDTAAVLLPAVPALLAAAIVQGLTEQGLAEQGLTEQGLADTRRLRSRSIKTR